MPLQLLSKKSWNVYAPDNIARVKRDQAEAQAREEEDDRKLQEQDAAHRLSVLRGEVSEQFEANDSAHVRASRAGKEAFRRDDYRKRKRLHGEDDTDRDLRIAQEDMERKHRRIEKPPQAKAETRTLDALITDRKGHINLFPVDEQAIARAAKNTEVEAEKTRKQREIEDQYTMRFSNAAGREGLKSGPWYATKKSQQRAEMVFMEGKDVWGRPDPSANTREQSRQQANDPLAFMQKAQTQLKQAERDKLQWHADEQSDSGPAAREHDRHKRERSRERHHHHKGRGHRRKSPRRAQGSHRRDRNVEKEYSRSDRHNSRSRKRSPIREALPEVPDDLTLGH